MGIIDSIGRGMKKLNPFSWGDESDSTKEQRADIRGQAAAAGSFADSAQAGYGTLGAEAQAQRDYLRRLAMGQEPSLAGEQLRQGLQQNVAAQRSMAAGASPGNAAMAARTASMNAARLGSGMAGQAALAGMQERRDANARLADMILQQRQQELQGTLGGRGQAIQGYGGYKPEASGLEKYGPAVMGGLGMLAKSDERAKTNVGDGDKHANRTLDALRAVTYRYKDERDGKGPQFGAMAQNLEKAGLGHAVQDTPSGKMVHGAKLALGNTALLTALHKRVKRLEGEK